MQNQWVKKWQTEWESYLGESEVTLNETFFVTYIFQAFGNDINALESALWLAARQQQ